MAIWLGAYKPRMLALTGAKADGWLPSEAYLELARLPELNAAIDDAAADAGRRPEAIRRLLNVSGALGDPDWAQRLAEQTLSVGTSTYILAAESAEEIRRFAGDVAPAVRDLVMTARGSEAAEPSPAPPSFAPPEPSAGQHLVEIHDHLRAELAQLHDLIVQVAAGSADPVAVRSYLNRMTIRQNRWTLGTFCETYCRTVTTHHTLEDRSVFPHLRRSDAALAPVLDRLEREHEGIHDLLEDVDRALVALVAEDDGIDGVQRAMDALTASLLEHFGYEERELVGPLDRHGFY